MVVKGMNDAYIKAFYDWEMAKTAFFNNVQTICVHYFNVDMQLDWLCNI